MAAASLAFTDAWAAVERGYRRPLSWLARHLRYALYPLLAVTMIGWLAWDWQHGRSLDAAEDAIFDTVVRWRPVEPTPSGRTVVVEIDGCSIEHCSWFLAPYAPCPTKSSRLKPLLQEPARTYRDLLSHFRF